MDAILYYTGWHPFCFCLNSFVVVGIYIFINRFCEFFKSRVFLLIAAIYLIFQSSEERFHNTVIIAITFSRHRLDNAMIF